VVAFDEFAGKKKRADKALVDILKNYMANKSFSRGIETLGAEASMVFVGNTRHTLPYMLRHSDLFDDLPEQYQDSAFLDRLHFYLPGWEVDIIRGEMFSDGYGFVVDYLAEILRHLRNDDYSHLYREQFDLLEDISTRDRTAVQKTFSGLMKILFPHREATPAEVEELLRFAVEGRKRVKDQLLRIDPTYPPVTFGYRDGRGQVLPVKTLEEELYPRHYDGGARTAVVAESESLAEIETAEPAESGAPNGAGLLQEKHLTFQENQRGVTFDALFGPYMKGATQIVVTDAYIRLFYQVRNLMEFMETIARHKDDDEEVSVHLVTGEDDFKGEQQIEYFERLQTACAPAGIHFTWEFDNSGSLHARHIVTDHGWKISLDRGLDVFQRYEMNDAFDLANRLQQYRACKAFEVTFLRVDAARR
jgi:ATP-dependent Lon protease